MANTITFCLDDPIKTSLNDWMFEHNNRVSVGVDKGDYFEILAYSDNKSDWPELSRMAKQKKAVHIKSVVSEGVTAID